MQFIYAIILGIIEGLTEFLPVSSTGHLILVEKIFSLEPPEFARAFMVIIQLGAILSVVVIYWSRLWPFHKKDWQGEGLKQKFQNLWTYREAPITRLWLKIIVGVLPAGILGFLLDDWIDAHLFSWKVVAIMLIVWGVIIILVERKNPTPTWVHHVNQISFRMALAIGIWQCLAMIPGTSRSAATIMGAMIMGVSRTAAAEFTFFLAIPTMLGATILKLAKLGTTFTGVEWLTLAIGFIVSFVVAYLVIKKFMDYIKQHDFQVFGYYRIILGTVVILSGLLGWIV